MVPSQVYMEAVAGADELLKGCLDARLGPGLSLAITTRDGLVTARAYGEANADSREPVTVRTLFQIGSITKHVIAVACLRLFAAGSLDPQAPVTDYLAWFEVGSRFDRPITLHHLLTHTSGLIMMMDCCPSSWWQTWALRDTELGFEPGAQFSYSNVGYNVLQCVIQTITGLSLDAALRDLVFEPLGMNESYGEIRNDLHHRMASGHRLSAHDDRPVSRPRKQTVVNSYEMSAGCGSVVTTPTDLARLLRMLLNGGRADDGSVFLDGAVYAMLTHPYVEMPGFFAGTSQGYGVLIEQSEETRGHRRILGGGENLGFEAAMYGDLDVGVGVILFCNSFDVPWMETRWLLDAVLASAEAAVLPELPVIAVDDRTVLAEDAAAYVGAYRDGERSFNIASASGRVRFMTGGTSAILERIYGDNFIVAHPGFDHAMLSFGRDEGGRVVEAFQHGDWYRNDAYRGPLEYDYPKAWDAYVGRFRAYGILVGKLTFFVRKGELVCQSCGGYVDTPLVPLGGGIFRVGGETSPHRMSFDCVADGKALRCRASDGDFYRA